MSSHLQPEQLLTVVALAADDPERDAAYRHAEGCPACAAALREHEAMLRVLDASFAPAEVSPALAARVHTRIYPRRWPRLLLLATWLGSLLMALLPANFTTPLSAHVGLHCTAFQALFAVAPLGLGLGLTRAGKARLDVTTFALSAGVAGLAGQWWLRGHCAVNGGVLHAFVFHFLTVIALSLLGGALGQRMLAVRT